MSRTIEISEYGLCIYSMDILQEFLKKEKIKTQKLLALFQKDKKKFLLMQKEGIWIPFPGIDSVGYCIKIKNKNEEFDDQWEKVLEYDGFNIEVENGFWVSDTSSFLSFNPELYQGEGRETKNSFGIVHFDSSTERWYRMRDGVQVYSDLWYDFPEGKYLLTIRGYAKKEIVDRRAVNFGYQFEFVRVDQFEGCKNPREEEYQFNVGSVLRARQKEKT